MGPLKGFRVIEMAGIGPGPFCGMLLSDLGAQVLRIERHGASADAHDPLQRNRLRLALDLKDPQQVAVLLDIVEHADALFEGYRPGVAERLGFGPDDCRHRNAKLVYGRMTGWGQDGPLASTAGHDINYIALSGALHAIGRRGERPVPPLNLVGDFGGGGMFLAFGMVCALLERERSGQGQVVDAAMVDGSIALMAMFLGMQAGGLNCDQVGSHFLSGAAHYYDTYQTKDGKFIAVGALEPQFYAELIAKAGFDPKVFGGGSSFMSPAALDPRRWAELKPLLAEQFMTRTRDEWCAVFTGSDACVAPVLTLQEAAHDPHNQARQAFVTVAGVTQNAPAPRFSRTPAAHPELATADSAAVNALLSQWGCSRKQLVNIAALSAQRAVAADSAA
jgi:alpha-methylacyl-CoA racemase